MSVVYGMFKAIGAAESDAAVLVRIFGVVSVPNVTVMQNCTPESESSVSERSATTPLPMETDPGAVFERLFGDSGSKAPLARLFFFQQKTAYDIGLGIPAEPLFRSLSVFLHCVVALLLTLL